MQKGFILKIVKNPVPAIKMPAALRVKRGGIAFIVLS